MGAILLVVVGVSLAVTSYYTYTSMSQDIISVQEEQIIGELELAESKIRIEWAGYCSINIRNVGDNPINLNSLGVYVNDKPYKIPLTQDFLNKNEGIVINISRDMLSGVEADISLKLGSKLSDAGKIVCPIPINGVLRATDCLANETCVVAFSGMNNSHLEDCSAGNYNYKLCVNDLSYVSLSSSDCEEEGIVTLSKNTNSQVEEYNFPTGFATKINVCAGSSKGDLNCIYSTDIAYCLSHHYGVLFSMSDSTNAHAADKDYYGKVVCCRIQ